MAAEHDTERQNCPLVENLAQKSQTTLVLISSHLFPNGCRGSGKCLLVWGALADFHSGVLLLKKKKGINMRDSKGVSLGRKTGP